MIAFYNFLDTVFSIYYWLIIAYILMSWIPQARDSAIGNFIGRFVEPYLAPFRRFIPPLGGMIDISPIVALFALGFLKEGIKFVISFFANLG